MVQNHTSLFINALLNPFKPIPPPSALIVISIMDKKRQQWLEPAPSWHPALYLAFCQYHLIYVSVFLYL